ncbi:MAG: MBL fold metallo-hydrolase [bacterium]|nr:MBL fold metallo-hydrolase [bacterium]
MRKVLTKWKTGLVKVAPGCWAYIQGGGLNVSNAGLIAGADAALAVDALYVRPMTQAFRRAIAKAVKKPLRHIVCTHHHADHTLGLAWFPKEIPVIASETMRAHMIASGLDLAHFRKVNPEFAKELRGLKQRFPDTTYEKAMTLHLGGRAVQLRHPGHAHSPGDTILYVPDAQVLYTGDICFNFVTPATFNADIGGWIRIARDLLKLKIRHIIPGHGPVTDRRGLEETLGYLEKIRREARKRFQAGMPARRAAKEIPLGGYADWMKPDRVEQAVLKLYNEFRGKAGETISLDQARGG